MYRDTDERKFDVFKELKFGDLGMKACVIMLPITRKKKNKVVPDLINSSSNKYKKLRTTIGESLQIDDHVPLVLQDPTLPKTLKKKRKSLGAWIVSYPSSFLQDLYLKYLGCILNDKSAGVRKASILALQDVYDVDDNVPSLGSFAMRFYKRMLDLADDNDISVSVCAISLVKQLLRRAIGALVYDHVIAQKFSSSQPHSSDDDAINLTILFCASVKKKAIGERIVPAIDHRKPKHTKVQRVSHDGINGHGKCEVPITCLLLDGNNDALVEVFI
nr:sister-chromatid cohesion protein 3 [Tanacetum cinerariifolium]